MSHPNILPLIGVMMNDNEYSMVTPWMDNGNIIEFLKDPENHEANPLKLVRTVFHFTFLFVEFGCSWRTSQTVFSISITWNSPTET